MDSHGNIVFVDQDRCFFPGALADRRDNSISDCPAKSKIAKPVHDYDDASEIRTHLIEATMEIPGVAEDLAMYISRVEAMPDAIFEGLARNASCCENELCSLFYIDTSDSSALAFVSALERWIERLLTRKRWVRKSIAKRIQQVLRAKLPACEWLASSRPISE